MVLKGGLAATVGRGDSVARVDRGELKGSMAGRGDSAVKVVDRRGVKE